MIKQYATYVKPERNVYAESLEDTFTINHTGSKFRRSLAKLLQWCLGKVAKVEIAYNKVDHVSYKKIELDFADIERIIFEQIHDLRRINEKPHMVIIGRDHLDAFYRLERSMTIQFPSNYRSHSYTEGGPIKFAGLEVKLVPWMEGLVVLPQ